MTSRSVSLHAGNHPRMTPGQRYAMLGYPKRRRKKRDAKWPRYQQFPSSVLQHSHCMGVFGSPALVSPIGVSATTSASSPGLFQGIVMTSVDLVDWLPRAPRNSCGSCPPQPEELWGHNREHFDTHNAAHGVVFAEVPSCGPGYQTAFAG